MYNFSKKNDLGLSTNAALAPGCAAAHGIVASTLRPDIQHDLPPLAGLHQKPAHQPPLFKSTFCSGVNA
jgi:hypothetical protein